ncbi:MAG: hypothetical protein V7760_07665 [Marinobacter sp.]
MGREGIIEGMKGLGSILYACGVGKENLVSAGKLNLVGTEVSLRDHTFKGPMGLS